MTRTPRQVRASRAPAPWVSCDGPCGERWRADMMVLVGRYVICPRDVKAVRAFDAAVRQLERDDADFARSNRQAMAELVRDEGEWTESATIVRVYFGLA